MQTRTNMSKSRNDKYFTLQLLFKDEGILNLKNTNLFDVI